MDRKEQVKNNILLEMKYHIDPVTMSLLGEVLTKVLATVEIVNMETLPATADDTNAYIIELFQINKAPKLSPGTVKYYLDTIRRLICAVQKPLPKVTSMDIELFLNSMRPYNSEVSLNNLRRNISAFYRWMKRIHLVIENPCDSIDPFKAEIKPIDHLEPEEVEQLKSGCKHPRDRALLEFLRCTAMRVGEVMGVKVCDINWRNGEIVIYGEKTRAYRSVYLDSVAMKYITKYLEARGIALDSTEPLFVQYKDGQRRGLNREGIRSSVKAICRRSGLERNVYPHLFRKTTATNIVKRGGSVHDAGEYIGHKDQSTAGRYYAYVSKDHTRQIFTKYVSTI